MEHHDKKVTRQEKIQITMMILTVIVICLMIFVIVTLIKNAEEIRQNPIDYAINNGNIERCVCYNDQNQIAYFGYENSNISLFET